MTTTDTHDPTQDRLRFRVGDRVRMTDAGIRQGLNGPRGLLNGVVVSVYVDGSIRVLRDRTKTPVRYAGTFWERDEPAVPSSSSSSSPEPHSPAWCERAAMVHLLVRE